MKLDFSGINELAFYSKIKPNKNGCWDWIGSKSRLGYGQLSFKMKVVKAHRVSYFLENGPFDNSLCCLHSCDRPSCVNPSHLWLGSMKENTLDMLKKGRHKSHNRVKKRCIRGHLLSGKNLLTAKGVTTSGTAYVHRICYTCHKNRQKLNYKKQKEAKK